jgi:hypothetical protein
MSAVIRNKYVYFACGLELSFFIGGLRGRL